jgi:hypothetical protein
MLLVRLKDLQSLVDEFPDVSVSTVEAAREWDRLTSLVRDHMGSSWRMGTLPPNGKMMKDAS